MPSSRRLAGLILAAVLSTVAVISVAAPAQASTGQFCVAVHLTGTGQDLGPDSQGNLHTSATLAALGIRVGTTAATFTPSGPPLGAALAFTGPIVFVPASARAR